MAERYVVIDQGNVMAARAGCGPDGLESEREANDLAIGLAVDGPPGRQFRVYRLIATYRVPENPMVAVEVTPADTPR